MYICIYIYIYIRLNTPGSKDSDFVKQMVTAASVAFGGMKKGDRRWNRNPRPRPQKFSKLVSLKKH